MSIWKMPISHDVLTDRSKNTLVEHLDIQFTEIGEDYLEATMPVDERTVQPLGLLNGGASLALAESVASTAANFCVDQATAYCVGIEINGNHLYSAKSGRVTGRATPVHLGRRTQVWEIKISNENGKLCCLSRMTLAVIERA